MLLSQYEVRTSYGVEGNVKIIEQKTILQFFWMNREKADWIQYIPTPTISTFIPQFNIFKSCMYELMLAKTEGGNFLTLA